MPAAEAVVEGNTYELAFHVLPTVAEGEVTAVAENIKSLIATHGGTIISEEAPARFELAYEIVKYLEGRNRKFSSAYFGWVRYTLAADQAATVLAEVESMKEILRAMAIKLTKVEAANPFFFHESVSAPRVETIEINDDEESLEEDEEAIETPAADEADEATDGEKAE